MDRFIAVRALLLVCAFLTPAASWAQSSGWEIEVHGGGVSISDLSGGTGSLPPAEPFTISSFPVPSLAVSSWYFGDGADLVNRVLSASALRVSQRVSPLDSVLTTRLADWDKGGSAGVRVGRELTSRFGVELGFDFIAVPMDFTNSARSSIEAANDSFANALPVLLDVAQLTGTSVTSNQMTESRNARQLAVTGALNINLLTQRRVVPYVTVGAGLVTNYGDMPRAELNGRYTSNGVVDFLNFTFDGIRPFPMDERDIVRVHHAIDDHVLVGVIGGGMKAFVTRRSGIRLDVRMHLGSHTVETQVSANPERTLSSNFGGVAQTLTIPSVQFSTSSHVPSSLSGPTIQDFRSFSVQGVFRQVLVTAGYFWRF